MLREGHGRYWGELLPHRYFRFSEKPARRSASASAPPPGCSRVGAELRDGAGEVARLSRDFRAMRDVELALHVPVIGDSVAPFMAPPDTDSAALRAVDSLAILPSDPAAAAEEIQRRREEIGFSYFVFGADFAEMLAPVVAELAGQ